MNTFPPLLTILLFIATLLIPLALSLFLEKHNDSDAEESDPDLLAPKLDQSKQKQRAIFGFQTD